MADVEFLRLSEYNPELNQREFDAVSFGEFIWRGLLKFERLSADNECISVYSDRSDILGDDYATRPGTIEEVIDAVRAREVIAKAIVSCFDHTVTVEALSDGKGGWITLETDT